MKLWNILTRYLPIGGIINNTIVYVPSYLAVLILQVIIIIRKLVVIYNYIYKCLSSLRYYNL